MKKSMFDHASSIALTLACCAAVGSSAEVESEDGPIAVNMPRYAHGVVFDPPSSMHLAAHVGKRAHTHLEMMFPPRKAGILAAPPSPGGASPFAAPVGGVYYETPASLSCLYHMTGVVLGCNPNSALANSTKGSKAIAIVDAYHYPTAKADLATFSAQMGLSAPTKSNFKVVYGTPGSVKPTDGVGSGWDIEAALDTQYAHGIAPNAKIYLVEAASNAFTDLFYAVGVAGSLVSAAGGGEVSMSWGGSEFSGETSFDSAMTADDVVYFASAGDSPGTQYPCVSPNVVCAGGTGNSRNPTNGNFQGTVAWTSTGGGVSEFEPRPSWQNGISNIVGAFRGAPDIAAVADPNTGVWVYNSSDGWVIVGGTSVASPVLAAISNASGHFYASSQIENEQIYSTLGVSGAGWNDVTNGWCQSYDGDLAQGGWDLCTGAGSPFGLAYK